MVLSKNLGLSRPKIITTFILLLYSKELYSFHFNSTQTQTPQKTHHSALALTSHFHVAHTQWGSTCSRTSIWIPNPHANRPSAAPHICLFASPQEHMSPRVPPPQSASSHTHSLCWAAPAQIPTGVASHNSSDSTASAYLSPSLTSPDIPLAFLLSFGSILYLPQTTHMFFLTIGSLLQCPWETLAYHPSHHSPLSIHLLFTVCPLPPLDESKDCLTGTISPVPGTE